MTFPTAIPEIPVVSIEKASTYYVEKLGFTFDWGDEQGGIAGISRNNCRLFFTNRSFRESYRKEGTVLFGINLESKTEVDELFAEWNAAQAQIVSRPEDKPWKLHEFVAADLDSNLIRVFYDFRHDLAETQIELPDG
jgi:predicted lactoylglutathione lyase